MSSMSQRLAVLNDAHDSDEAEDAGCERLRHKIEVAANRLEQGTLHSCRPSADTWCACACRTQT